jgi:sulfatase modifying factor 1
LFIAGVEAPIGRGRNSALERIALALGSFELFALLVIAGCTCQSESGPKPVGTAAIPSGPLTVAMPASDAVPRWPELLYVPDAAAPLETVETAPHSVFRRTSCPPEMVSIQGAYCIDRYESSLVDREEGRRVSPYYHPSVTHTRSAYRTWQQERFNMGEPEYQNLPLPEPPPFQMQAYFDVKSIVLSGAVPNGYLNQAVAKRACENAGKRLCSEVEWVRACRGEQDRQFPYGDVYIQGKCNVFNGSHPAKILHGNTSLGHLDPRLNEFTHKGSPLLHATGSHPECKSRWGDDAVYDMVGNLDEWIDDPEGTFLGGFYARATKDGCLSRIGSHPTAYFDYSLGVRCCR